MTRKSDQIKVRVFDPGNSDGFVEVAAEVYASCGFGDINKNIEALSNSSYFGIVYLGGEPVGVGRVLSDKVQHSLIVDLNIKKEFRGRGCGKKLIQALALRARTRNVVLGTDPRNPSLPEFYKKAGFELIQDSVLFRWPKQ